MREAEKNMIKFCNGYVDLRKCNGITRTFYKGEHHEGWGDNYYNVNLIINGTLITETYLAGYDEREKRYQELCKLLGLKYDEFEP